MDGHEGLFSGRGTFRRRSFPYLWGCDRSRLFGERTVPCSMPYFAWEVIRTCGQAVSLSSRTMVTTLEQPRQENYRGALRTRG